MKVLEVGRHDPAWTCIRTCKNCGAKIQVYRDDLFVCYTELLSAFVFVRCESCSRYLKIYAIYDVFPPEELVKEIKTVWGNLPTEKEWEQIRREKLKRAFDASPEQIAEAANAAQVKKDNKQ